jgi:HNH endonuclease/helix-turn-helix, Psq domain
MRYISRVILTCAYAPCAQPFVVLPYQAKTWKYCSPVCYTLDKTTQTHEAFVQRFWSKVTMAGPDECWPWTAALHGKDHYGNFRATPYKSGDISAHVVSWFLHTGEWPPKGLFVLHACDRPSCVNPAHLSLGTQSENMQDCIRKGRNGMKTKPERAIEGIRRWNREHPTRPQTSGERNGTHTHPERVRRGEQHPHSKLTDAQWAEALTLYTTGQCSQRMLAKRYGISQTAIRYRLKTHEARLNTGEK